MPTGWASSENPLDGVKPPQYTPERAVIPSVSQLQAIRKAGDDTFLLLVDLMSGCGMRNGEAAAVNLDNIVANDVYRIAEQVSSATRQYGRPKHRKVGDYRDVPLPARVKNTMEWYADKYGTVDGYLLRHPNLLNRASMHGEHTLRLPPAPNSAGTPLPSNDGAKLTGRLVGLLCVSRTTRLGSASLLRLPRPHLTHQR